MKIRRSVVKAQGNEALKRATTKEAVTMVDESFEAVADTADQADKGGTSTQVAEASDEVFEGFTSTEPEGTVTASGIIPVLPEEEDQLSAGADEEAYKATELQREAAPIIQDTVHTEVKRAVKLNNDRLKVEVNEVLQDEVGYRLDKYERRRKFRQRKDLVFSAVKGVLILVVVLFIMGNTQLRTRLTIIGKDFAELFGGLVRNEEVSSNKLVEDMFRDLGDDLNDVNTVVYEEPAE